MSLLKKTWVRAAISVLGLILIIVMELTTRQKLFAWSLDVIIDIDAKNKKGLLTLCKFLKATSGYFIVALLITWYVAMFKRRH
jgi:hypothetical protein